MLSNSLIKEAAYAAGADACGISPISRMKGAPAEMNPTLLFPNCKSMIGFVFRIPRGVQRGIEEGTQFYQYPSMAYGGINEIFAPAVLYSVGKVIEEKGVLKRKFNRPFREREPWRFNLKDFENS